MLNLLKAQDALKNSSDQQLVQMMHSPSAGAPSYLVMTEIKRRADMRKNAGPGGYPEGTLAEEYPAQLQQSAMPQQAPMMPQQMTSQMPPQMTPQQSMQGFAEGGGVGSNPGIFSPQNGWQPFWKRLDWRREPWTEPGYTWNPRTGIPTENPPDVSDELRRYGIDPNAGFASAVPQPIAAQPGAVPSPGVPNSGYDPEAISAIPGMPMAPPQQRRPVAQPGIPSPGSAGGAGGGSPLGSYEQYLKQAAAMTGSANDPLAAIREQMKELQVDPEKLKNDALSNALMTAGFGMMSARGNLASAIGQGGLAGLSAYNRGIGDVRQQKLQNLGVESKIAEAQAAAARGDRVLAMELMKEANTRDYRNRALGIQAQASNRADARAEASLKASDIRARASIAIAAENAFQKELERASKEIPPEAWTQSESAKANRRRMIHQQMAISHGLGVSDQVPDGASVYNPYAAEE